MSRPAEGFSPQIQQLKPHHRCMARDVVAGGLRNKDLKQIYGMSDAQISIIMNSPVFQAELARLERMAERTAVEVREELQDLVPQARSVLTRALYDPLTPQKLAVDTAFGVLKLVAPKEESREAHLHLHKHVHEMQDEELRDSVFELIEAETVDN